MPDRLLNIGAKPDDPPELRRRKRLMVAFSMAVMPTGFVWGAIYYVLGETTAAAVPIAYMPFAAANLAAFARTRDLDQVRRGQCLLILSLPFVLHVALGGFEPSSGVVLWSVLAPFCALVFGGIGAGSRWLVAFSQDDLASRLRMPVDDVINRMAHGDVVKYTIVVPEGIPIVTVKPGDRSLLVPGAKVFVFAQTRDGKLTAMRATVGRNGFAPPM